MLFNIIIFFIFGTIIGSFLNVVVFRYNTNMSFMSGRSKCLSCGKHLFWYELVPLWSFIFLKGRCLNCNSKISAQYFWIEFFTGLSYAALFWQIGFSWILILYLLAASLLIVITAYDLGHKIIPDGFVYPFNAIAALIIFFSYGFLNIFSGQAGMDFLGGIILFAFFGALWLVSEGRWMGFGDAKLALGVGWMLGFSGGIFAIISAFWIGAIWSLILIAFEKLKILKRHHITIKSEIPFAPFIALGVLLQIITGWNLGSLIGF